LISQSNSYAAAPTLRAPEENWPPQKQQGETPMTALVLENLAALAVYAKGLRMLLARFARALDALVSARAARAVPEWQMRQVRTEIDRFRDLVRTSYMRGRKTRV
jgi:hypothetical protein